MKTIWRISWKLYSVKFTDKSIQKFLLSVVTEYPRHILNWCFLWVKVQFRNSVWLFLSSLLVTKKTDITNALKCSYLYWIIAVLVFQWFFSRLATIIYLPRVIVIWKKACNYACCLIEVRVGIKVLMEVKCAEVQSNRNQQLLWHCYELTSDWCLVWEPFHIHLSLWVELSSNDCKAVA